MEALPTDWCGYRGRNATAKTPLDAWHPWPTHTLRPLRHYGARWL